MNLSISGGDGDPTTESAHLQISDLTNSCPRLNTRGKIRMRIETIYGWLKNVAGWRKARFVGRWKLRWYAQASAATYNFLRLTRLAMAG